MTADFVAVMAKAARLYKDDAPTDAAKYLAAAQLGYAYLARQRRPGRRRQRRPQLERPTCSRPATTSRPIRTIGCGRPPSCGRRPATRRCWPTSRRARRDRTVAADFDWPNVANLGIYTYLLSQRPDAAARDATLVSTLSAGADDRGRLAGDAPPARTPSGGRSGTTSTGGRTARSRARRCCSGSANLLDPDSEVPEHHPDAGRLPAGAELVRSLAGDDGRLPPADRAAPWAVDAATGSPIPGPGCWSGGANSTVEDGVAFGHQLDRRRRSLRGQRDRHQLECPLRLRDRGADAAGHVVSDCGCRLQPYPTEKIMHMTKSFDRSRLRRRGRALPVRVRQQLGCTGDPAAAFAGTWTFGSGSLQPMCTALGTIHAGRPDGRHDDDHQGRRDPRLDHADRVAASCATSTSRSPARLGHGASAGRPAASSSPSGRPARRGAHHDHLLDAERLGRHALHVDDRNGDRRDPHLHADRRRHRHPPAAAA